jgi:hypothetical protein
VYFKNKNLATHTAKLILKIDSEQDKSRDRSEGGVMMMQRVAKMDEAAFREKLKNMGQVPTLRTTHWGRFSRAYFSAEL